MPDGSAVAEITPVLKVAVVFALAEQRYPYLIRVTCLKPDARIQLPCGRGELSGTQWLTRVTKTACRGIPEQPLWVCDLNEVGKNCVEVSAEKEGIGWLLVTHMGPWVNTDGLLKPILQELDKLVRAKASQGGGPLAKKPRSRAGAPLPAVDPSAAGGGGGRGEYVAPQRVAVVK
jgi:hypothetical protein